MADLVTSGEVTSLVAGLASHPGLSLLISAASAAIEKRLNRTLASGTVTETYSGAGLGRIWLRRLPVSAVTAVSINGSALDNTNSDAWGFNSSTGELWRGLGHDNVRYAAVFPRGSQNVTVTYTGGYATIPADLKVACIALIQHMANGAKYTGIFKSEELGDYAYTLADAALLELPPLTLQLLSPYVIDYVA
jgi:hypothetical protein